jgi:cell division protein FtsW (lipid II flippase)
VHTDFVFAAIGEELGFLGAAAVLLTYMLLLYRAFRIAICAQSAFQQLTVGGLAIFLGLQTLLIIGGVTKFLPLTGVTLPFISYGGSSLISNFILLGILFAASEPGAYDA